MSCIGIHNVAVTGYCVPARQKGYTLVEIMVVLAIMAILGAVAIPALTSFYGECCIKTAVCELTDMIKEAKNNALNDGCDYAVGFNTNSGTISLLIGKGGDGKWNTDDDIVKRSFCLARKGGGLRFGYGDYGPPDGLAKASDGVSFSNNTLVCNPELTGSSGTVYLYSAFGAAMALTMNTTDYGYTLRRWDGKKWVKL